MPRTPKEIFADLDSLKEPPVTFYGRGSDKFNALFDEFEDNYVKPTSAYKELESQYKKGEITKQTFDLLFSDLSALIFKEYKDKEKQKHNSENNASSI